MTIEDGSSLKPAARPAQADAANEAVRWDAVVTALIFVVPLVLAFLLYAPWITDPFALDDYVWLRAVHDRSLTDVVRRAFEFPPYTAFDGPTPFFRPLADVGFWAQKQLFGMDATPYRVLNLVIHGLVAGLGGLFVARLMRSPGAGLATAAAFVVYSSYAFAVPWISQLSELLGAPFGVSALVAYHAYLADDAWPRARWYLGGAMLAAVLALASKESQSALFLVLPVLAVMAPDRRRPWREVVPGLIALGAVALAHALFVIANDYSGTGADESYGLGTHVLENLRDYLGRLAFPFSDARGFIVEEPRWITAMQMLGAMSYLALGAVALLTRRRAAAFLFVWSLIALAPFTSYDGVTQWRYTYVPALPFVAFVVAMGTELVRATPERPRPLAAGALVGTLVVVMLFTAREARDEQQFLAAQAVAHEEMMDAVRAQCGTLPPDSRIYVTGSSAFDPYGVSLPAAVNLLYDRATLIMNPEQLPAPSSTVCVVRVQ